MLCRLFANKVFKTNLLTTGLVGRMEQVKQMPAPQLKCLVVGQRAKSPERGRSAWRAVFTDC